MMHSPRGSYWVVLFINALLLTACGGDSSDGNTSDSGVTSDSALPDGGIVDTTVSIDAAWHRFDTTHDQLVLIAGTKSYIYDYGDGTWADPTELAGTTGPWTENNAPFGQNTANNNQIDLSPVDAAWHRYDGATHNKVAVVRGNWIYTYEYETSEWTTPVDQSESSASWSSANGPFGPNSANNDAVDTSPVDAAWHRFGTKNKVSVVRGSWLYSYDFDLAQWETPVDQSAVADEGWRVSNAPFGANSANANEVSNAPIEAAWHRYDEGDNDKVVIVRGGWLYSYDFPSSSWETPVDQTGADKAWVMTGGPFAP